MAPSAPKKERQGVAPDSKMTKERAMQLKGALINYAKKTNDNIKGMVHFHQFLDFSSKMLISDSKFTAKITKKKPQLPQKKQKLWKKECLHSLTLIH